MHEVQVGRSATKELEGLPQQVLTRIANKIDALASDPHLRREKTPRSRRSVAGSCR